MNEIQKITEEIKSHPLKHRLINEHEAFNTKKRKVNTVQDAVKRIKRYEREVSKCKGSIRYSKLTGKEKAHNTVVMRGKIKRLVEMIAIELEKLCNI